MAAQPAIIWLSIAIGGVLVAGFSLLVLQWRDRRARRNRTGIREQRHAERVTASVRARSHTRPAAGMATAAQGAYADPEQTLRLNAVRDAARSLDAGAYRLQQTSVRTMTSMMRLRRALAEPETPQQDAPPAWMLRRPSEIRVVSAEAPDERRVVQMMR